MNILLDLDGVLSDFFSEALNRLNQNFVLHMLPKDYCKLQTFNMAEVWKITQKQFWTTLEKDDDFWCTLKPFPWATKLVDFLSTKGEITICTSPSHHPVCAKQKIEWVMYYLGLNSSNLMIGGRKYLMARPDCVLIDDYPKNVETFKQVGGQAILVPSNWNTENLTFEKVKQAIVHSRLLKAPDTNLDSVDYLQRDSTGETPEAS